MTPFGQAARYIELTGRFNLSCSETHEAIAAPTASLEIYRRRPAIGDRAAKRSMAITADGSIVDVLEAVDHTRATVPSAEDRLED
jgi:hypothetical protein